VSGALITVSAGNALEHRSWAPEIDFKRFWANKAVIVAWTTPYTVATVVII